MFDKRVFCLDERFVNRIKSLGFILRILFNHPGW